MSGASEFWAGIVGAVVGAVSSGLISYWLQNSVFQKEELKRKLEDKERKIAICQSVLIKCMSTHTNVMNMHKHILEAREISTKMQYQFLAQAVQPLANIPDKAFLTADEQSILLSLGDFDKFHNVLDAENIHNSNIAAFIMHRDMRKEFDKELKLHEIKGEVADVSITNSRLIELHSINNLLEQIAFRLPNDVKSTELAMNNVVEILRTKLGQTIKLKFVSPTE